MAIGKLFRGVINAIRRLFGWKDKDSSMRQGLQIWDSNGNIVLDTDSRTIKILGRFEYNPSIQVISSELFITEDTFYIITPQFRYDDADLQVSFEGSVCRVRNTKQYFPKTIYVGVY